MNDRLGKIRARLGKATPGDYVSMAGVIGPYDEAVVAVNGDSVKPIAAPPKPPEGDNWAADSDLFANAPADLRYLLEHIEEQASLLRRAWDVIATDTTCYPDCCDTCRDREKCPNKAVLDEMAAVS